MIERIARDVDCVVMDCDGVIWHGDTLLPGVRGSIALLREQGKRLVFVTNNSNKSRAQYVHKFETLGIHVEKEEVFSAAFAAAAYLKTQGWTRRCSSWAGGASSTSSTRCRSRWTLVCLTPPMRRGGLEELFVEDDVGAVIVGQDTRFTYAKLAYASLAIQKGARFVATNPDAADSSGPG